MSQDLDLGRRATTSDPSEGAPVVRGSFPDAALVPVDAIPSRRAALAPAWKRAAAASKRSALGRRLLGRSARSGASARSSSSDPSSSAWSSAGSSSDPTSSTSTSSTSTSSSSAVRSDARSRPLPRAQDIRAVRLRRVVDAQVPPALATRRTGPRPVDVDRDGARRGGGQVAEAPLVAAQLVETQLVEAQPAAAQPPASRLTGARLAEAQLAGAPLGAAPVGAAPVGAGPAAERPAVGPTPAEPTDDVPRWMRTAGGYAWRILAMVGVMALVVYSMARVQLVFVAVFLALVLTAVLRPAVNRLTKVMPRPLATVVALLAGVLTAVALLAYVVNSVASQWTSLAGQFNDGTGQILTFLENRDGRIPFTVTPETITVWIESGRQWVVDHSGDLASNAVASAGSVAKVFGALALAAFCSVFFLARGAEMWSWLVDQLPVRARGKVRDAGAAGWYTFSGYARGTVIIALADGVLAGIVLAVLDVPLAAPLAVLVFIGAFIPLIGAPLAMLVAMVVALAANGLLNAVLVGLAIALIGQFEGHILQPVVMGRQVSLHPVVVALAVTAGTLLAGIVGAIVAVPVVAVAWAVYAKLRNVSPPLSAPRASIKVTRRAA